MYVKERTKRLNLPIHVQQRSVVTNSPASLLFLSLLPLFPILLYLLLPGLETFNSHPLLLSSLDNLAVGKILLMETLEPCQQSETPVAVLYDTSQDDDVNINSTCLKALQDKTMNNPLTVRMVVIPMCIV